jgi:hypothetical protein
VKLKKGQVVVSIAGDTRKLRLDKVLTELGWIHPDQAEAYIAKKKADIWQEMWEAVKQEFWEASGVNMSIHCSGVWVESSMNPPEVRMWIEVYIGPLYTEGVKFDNAIRNAEGDNMQCDLGPDISEAIADKTRYKPWA